MQCPGSWRLQRALRPLPPYPQQKSGARSRTGATHSTDCPGNRNGRQHDSGSAGFWPFLVTTNSGVPTPKCFLLRGLMTYSKRYLWFCMSSICVIYVPIIYNLNINYFHFSCSLSNNITRQSSHLQILSTSTQILLGTDSRSHYHQYVKYCIHNKFDKSCIKLVHCNTFTPV